MSPDQCNLLKLLYEIRLFDFTITATGNHTIGLCHNYSMGPDSTFSFDAQRCPHKGKQRSVEHDRVINTVQWHVHGYKALTTHNGNSLTSLLKPTSQLTQQLR